MADNGWQNLDSIMDALFGAAAASAIAGASEAFDNQKRALRRAAPVGQQRKSVHFANPQISGGRIRRGGRTQGSINWASPDIDITKIGDAGRVEVTATLVMAPQGFYQNDGPKPRVIRPRHKKTLGFFLGGVGVWPKTSFAVVGGQNKGWIDRTLSTPVRFGARMRSAWGAQFTAGGQIRVQPAHIIQRGFTDESRDGDFFDTLRPRAHQADLPYRRALQARSRRAATSWNVQVAQAFSRLR